MHIGLDQSRLSQLLRSVAALALLISCFAGQVEASGGRSEFPNSIAPLLPHIARTLRAFPPHRLSQTVEFQIPLRMRNFAHLQSRIERGEIVPRAELERDYFPTAADYDTVLRWAAGEGMTVTRTDPSRLSVFIRGTLEQIQRSLQVEMAEVTVDGRDYPAARTHPSLPDSIAPAVIGINGLQPFLKAVKHQAVKQSATNPNAPPYLVSEMLSAYNAAGLGVTGSGQKIAILIDTLANSSDLTGFWNANGIPQSLSNVETINVNNLTLTAPAGEETMDEEWTSGIAPAAKIRVYAAGSLSFGYLDVALQRLISDLPTQPQLHQLSISLGLGETYLMSNGSSSQMTTDSQYFATLAASGVSVFVSSGDGGSNPTNTGVAGGTSPTVEYYSSDPNVTGVGGTTITLDGSGNIVSETAWVGSGGGISQFFARPSWQVGSTVPSGTKRLVPDVALDANPSSGAYVYLNGGVWQYGGTSLGAPVWAGFCALINEARSRASLGPMGNLNPRIYPLSTANFRDITSGSNGVYTAGTGYDMVTGLGSPRMGQLIQSLLAPTLSTFSPALGPALTTVTLTGLNFAGVSSVAFNGVPASFSVDSESQITATLPFGAGTGPITVTTANGVAVSASHFTVIALPPPSVLRYSPTSGPVGATVTVTGSNMTSISSVTFNGIAASFTSGSSTQIIATVPAGATSGPIVVSNPSGGGAGAGSFYVTAGSGTATLYSTGFETSEGYVSGALAGQKGWVAVGSGGNGFASNIFSGQASAGYIGSTAPTSGTVTYLRKPLNRTPAVAEVTTFSTLMEIVTPRRSSGRDLFRWIVRNSAGAALFSLDFNNSTKTVGYWLDDNTTHANEAGITFASGSPYTLTVTIDWSHNFWSATLSGYTLATAQPITNTGATLDLGDIDPYWGVLGSSAGTNYLAFDNYTVTTAIPNYAVTVSATSPLSGTVSGAGTYQSGSTITVIATPSAGYGFANWTEGGVSVSGTAAYAFPVAANRNLVAQFSQLSFAYWVGTYFTSGELADAGVSGPLADPDRDGVPNLLEYAFGTNPKTPNRSGLPRVAVENGYLTITYSVNPNAPDVTFVVEVSGDLVTWNSGPAWTSTPTPVPGTNDYKASDLTPVTPGVRHFIRVRVVAP